MSRKLKTRIRMIASLKVADFDDQIWPINVAILILAGFVAGIIITMSSFTDPRLLYNGWVRLGSVALMVGILAWAVFWLQGRVVRRVQLCLIVSLLAHLWLGVVLHEKYLAFVTQRNQEEARRLAEELEPITMPDYNWSRIEQPSLRQSFEKPVEVEVTEQADLSQVEKQDSEYEPPLELPRPDDPETSRREQPDPAELRKAELSAPRRADEAAGAQITRQEWKHRLEPDEPIPQPVVKSEGRRTPSMLHPQETAIERRQAEPAYQRQMFRREPSATSQTDAMKLARRATETEPLVDVPTTRTPTRQFDRPAEVARTEAKAPNAIRAVQETRPNLPEANPTLSRQQLDVPLPNRSTTSASLAQRQTVAKTLVERQQSAETPQLAQARRQSDARTTRQAAMPSADLAEDMAQTAPAPIRHADLNPTESEVSRQVTPIEPVTAQAAQSRLPAMTSVAQLPSAVARRQDATAEQPAKAAVSTNSTSLARASGGVSLPSTAVAAENVAAPPAAGSAPESQLQASPTPVARSTTEAPQGPTIAASGPATAGAGSAELLARTGQPRAAGLEQPTVAKTSSAPRFARSTVGTPAPVTEHSQVAEIPSPSAATGRGPTSPTADVKTIEVGRVGGMGIPAPAMSANTGSGPAATPGTPGPESAVQLARVTGVEARFSASSGGGSPRPARSIGRALAGDAKAEAPEASEAAPSGTVAGHQLEAQVSGQSRPAAGLPGSIRVEASAGAIASTNTSGLALSAAAARRATASQESPGRIDFSPGAGATLAKSRSGTNLPATAARAEEVFEAGAGGLASTRGDRPSNLDVGSNTSVRRAAADVPSGPVDLAAGEVEFGAGSAVELAFAGRLSAASPSRAFAGDAVDLSAPSGPTGRAVRMEPQLSAADLADELLDTVSAPLPADEGAGSASGNAAPQPDALGQRRQMTGLVDELVRRMPVETATVAGPTATTPGTMTGPRRRPPGEDSGPSLAADVGGGPPRKRDSPGLPRGLVDSIEPESIAAAETNEPGDFDVAAGSKVGGPSRREGGLPVQIAAAAGPGGLSYQPSPVVGIPGRRARPESEVIYPISRRFVVERSGGRLLLDGRVGEEPAEAFSRRSPGRRAEAARIYGGTEGTEKAVEMALEFFARNQFPDGHWSIDSLPDSAGPEYRGAAVGQMNSDTAGTGLALLSFLGAGYTHQDDKHRQTVRRGIEWLIANQQPGGELFTNQTDQTRYARSYAHGIATIALCEAYGMTRDPDLRNPARAAVEYICGAQHPEFGGWRYTPKEGDTVWRKESDTSVSGWQLMALTSAKMAGLPVPDEVVNKVSGWLDYAQAEGGSRYMYNPDAANSPQQRQGRAPNRAMTAEGILMRMYLGWDRSNPAMIEGAEFLKANLPEIGSPSIPLRDCYYWYYATQVMFHMQGDYWSDWNGRLHPMLEVTQQQSGPMAGSWDPTGMVPDRWAHAGGRHYVTAMNVLMLEVFYRHLPLFQTLEK